MARSARHGHAVTCVHALRWARREPAPAGAGRRRLTGQWWSYSAARRATSPTAPPAPKAGQQRREPLTTNAQPFRNGSTRRQRTKAVGTRRIRVGP
jgi:hypothetical protein